MATESLAEVLAVMRVASPQLAGFADRLAAAHAAEDSEIREILYGTLDRDRDNITTRNLVVVAVNALQRERERAEAAERDARELRQDIAKAYAMIPNLPVGPETCDAATDALHQVGLMMGIHGIDPAIATTEQADED